MTTHGSKRNAPLRITPDDLDARRRAMVWGERVRLERFLRGWSQSDLARIAGVTQAQVSRIERGARTITHPVLTRIARAFVIPAAEAFPYDDVDDHFDDELVEHDGDPPAPSGVLLAS